MQLRKLNVMLMIRNMEFGGAQVVVNQLLNGLNRGKFNLSLCIMTDEDNSLLEDKYDLPADIHLFRKRGRYDLGLVLKIRKLLKRSEIDILHTHGWTADVWGRLAACLARTPIILSHSHTNQPASAKTSNFMYRYLTGATDHFIAIGEGNKNALIEEGGIPAEKITVIRNVVDYRKFDVAVDTDAGKIELGVAPGNLVVSIIGRLHSIKGHEHFLRTARIIASENDSVEFLVVGSGGLEESLRRQAGETGLADKVHFLGARKDIPRILALTDVFVMSSLYEGLPLILLEAMAAGKAIAATDIDGCRELIVNGETGFLTPPGHPEAQAEVVLRFLSDERLRHELGKKARTEAIKNYSLEKMLGEIGDLYIRLAGKKRREPDCPLIL